jgi:hypothetical protein
MATTKDEEVLLGMPIDQAFQRTLATIQAMGWKVSAADQATGHVEATTSVSAFSWGEKVSVRLTPTEGGTIALVQSAARLKTNVTARGRNRKNVEALANQLRM